MQCNQSTFLYLKKVCLVLYRAYGIELQSSSQIAKTYVVSKQL